MDKWPLKHINHLNFPLSLIIYMKPEPEGEQSREKLAALALSKLRISWYHFIDKALLCLD